MAGKWQVWYPHLIDAWQGSATIQTFSHAAYRGYHNLIMEQFQAEDGKLPDDDRQLSKLSRLGADWMNVAQEVRDALETDGAGRLFSSTQFELWKDAHERHETYINRMEHARGVKAQHKAQINPQINTQINDSSVDGQTKTETETETKTGTKKKAKTCAEASSTPIIAALDDHGNPLTLPLINGTDWPVPAADCLAWASAFPATNVLAELLKMRVWLDANPKNRKTPGGVRSFIVRWMGRAQDSARVTGGSNANGNRGQARTNGNIAAAKLAADRIIDRMANSAGGGARG